MNHISFFKKKAFHKLNCIPVSILYAHFLSADFQLEGCIFIAIVMPHNLKKPKHQTVNNRNKEPKKFPAQFCELQ